MFRRRSASAVSGVIWLFSLCLAAPFTSLLGGGAARAEIPTQIQSRGLAAIDAAVRVLSASLVTAVPEDYFDRLMAALDEPEVAPRLRDAVVRARENPRVHPG